VSDPAWPDVVHIVSEMLGIPEQEPYVHEPVPDGLVRALVDPDVTFVLWDDESGAVVTVRKEERRS
jgi:hypothetical protein